LSLATTVLGWLGAAGLLLAYGLTSTGRLAPEGARFQLLNLAGALALTANSAYHSAWPSAVLNVVWIGIGAVALIRARRGGPKGSGSPRPADSQPTSCGRREPTETPGPSVESDRG
jgi:hypothetical protein